MPTCALCKYDKPLMGSHVIPQFVYDRIKANSPTGYLRGGISDVNLRKQDGDKLKLLCGDCEQRFSKAEKTFSEEVFRPYHESGTLCFEYGPWLSYFICSVNWRTLHLDNIGFHKKKEWLDEILLVLDEAERVLSDYLLGNRSDIGSIENHICPMFEITGSDSPLKEPNFLFRASVFDYTWFVPADDAFYVCANLAGVLIFTIIRKGVNDIWDNTLVSLNGGSIKQPQRINSPLICNMVQLLDQSSQNSISQKQKDKIIESLKKNPEASQAKSFQYRKLDRKLQDNQQG